MLLDFFNFSSLAILAIIDFASYKIPNVILLGWLGGLATSSLIENVVNSTAPSIITQTLIASTLVTGSYFPLKKICQCNAGDFKLFGVLTLATGAYSGLSIIMLSCLISFVPIAGRIRKIPMATMTFFGYIAYLLIK